MQLKSFHKTFNIFIKQISVKIGSHILDMQTSFVAKLVKSNETLWHQQILQIISFKKLHLLYILGNIIIMVTELYWRNSFDHC